MTRRRIRSIILTKKAYTLIEVLVVCVITVILFASVIGTFVVASNLYNTGIAAQDLQRDVNGVLGRIVKGTKEGGARYGLRSAVSFVSPISPVSEIDFTGLDGKVRKYYLSAGSIVYQSPTETPNLQTIYTPPAHSTVLLRFLQPATGSADNETAAIYLAVTRQISGRTISGSLTTYVNLRNMPK